MGAVSHDTGGLARGIIGSSRVIVLATAGVAWLLGSVIGFAIGAHGGRPLLDHPGTPGETAPQAAGQGRPRLRPAHVRGVRDVAGLRVRDLPRAVLAVPAGSAGLSKWRASRQARLAGQEPVRG